MPTETSINLTDSLAGLPGIRDAWSSYLAEVWMGPLDAVTMELCRLRLAQIMQSPADLQTRVYHALDAGLDEAKIAELTRWPDSPRFSDKERACLGFAEQFALDALGMRDEDVESLLAHIDPPSLVNLTIGLGLYHGLIRFRLATGAKVPLEPIVVDHVGASVARNKE